MEIYREGKKIILTEQELFLAYEEQENIYDYGSSTNELLEEKQIVKTENGYVAVNIV
ncbi:hypothetical protein IMSAGC018_02280 [Lachnospiraceae bacterium]|nr:hypothetical protein IMSAGC018_02280 [Lachnospiraceae bacterium]